jgi:hypothetical protein
MCQQRRRQRLTVTSDAGSGSGALQQAQAGRPIGPRFTCRHVPPPNPHLLRFRLVRGHRGVSARRLERGAPRCIPRPHRLPEHAAAARRAYQQLDHERPTVGHGIVEGGAEVDVAGIPCQQVSHAASAAAAAGRADPPPPATAIGVDPNAVVVVVVCPLGGEHPHIKDTREATMFFWQGLYNFCLCGILLTKEKVVHTTLRMTYVVKIQPKTPSISRFLGRVFRFLRTDVLFP